jgi:hypothetical protein
MFIAEFMASNKSVLADGEGDFSDWIEIYNASATETIDLNGWRLTDDAQDLAKWVFPPIDWAPGAFLIVFASDKNQLSLGKAADQIDDL